MTPETLRQLAGVDRLPMPAALRHSMRRHHPPELRETGGSVLADVEIDAQGTVRSVTIVPRPSQIHAVMVLRQADGAERIVQPKDDPAFGPAAEAALMETRFIPAIRDGVPVPFTLRMTIDFDPPAAPEGLR